MLIVTYVSTPHGEQAEGQRPASGREETGEVVSEGKMGAHHLHAEQNTYRRGEETGENRELSVRKRLETKRQNTPNNIRFSHNPQV